MIMLISGLYVICLAIYAIYKKRKQYGPREYGTFEAWIKGKQLVCSHCEGNRFSKREGLINTTFLSFFFYSAFNRSATCYVCTSCSQLHWFRSKGVKYKNYESIVSDDNAII